MDNQKYPRTQYLPFSPALPNRSQTIALLSGLVNQRVVITEKLDGSNVCLTTEQLFARSHNGPPPHPSFDYLKGWHAGQRHKIPGWNSVFGEYCYAVHSIEYEKLPFPLFIFGVRDELEEEWMSWPDVVAMARQLGVPTVPVLFNGSFSHEGELEKQVLSLMKQPSFYGPEREGLVVRVERSFGVMEFDLCVAKAVRPNHVQTEQHWTNQPIKRQPF